MKKRIYLDSNATTPLDIRVVSSIIEFLNLPVGNPSSQHFEGQMGRSIIVSARRSIASYFGVKMEEIVFTSGATEGANFTIRGSLHPTKKHIITSNVEHAAVFETLEDLKKAGYKVTQLPAGLKGAIELESLEKAITEETGLITLIGANNETGVKSDLLGIAKIAEERKIPLVIDGVALLGKGKFQIPKGVSAIFFSGHKIHAPQGVGFVVFAPRFKLKPYILGGAQEWQLRGGTENIIGIMALQEAIEILKVEEESAHKKMRYLRDKLEKALLEIPLTSVNGYGERIVNTSNICFKGVDGESFMIALDLAGISVSLGSACSSGAIEPSRVLLQMGLSQEMASSSLRFSISRMTTEEEIDLAVEIIKRVHATL